MPREAGDAPEEAHPLSLIRSNKALHVPESPEGARAGSPAGSSGGAGISPERPLSPPQGQRRPLWAPRPSSPAAAGALRRRRRRQHRCPCPRRHPPAAGSGTGRGAAGARAPPPARPLPPPPPSARPAPSPGPCPPRQLVSCRGTPASTASRRRRCLPPPSPRSPRHRRPTPAPVPAPVPRPCAGPAAGISSARPAFLFSYAISITDGAAAATQKTLRSGPMYPSIGCPLLGQGRGPGASLSAVFLSTRMGGKERKPPKKQQKTHRIGDYLFVFNLFCHIFVKRQKCNKKYISTVPKGGAVEKGHKGPNDEVGASSLGAWQA